LRSILFAMPLAGKAAAVKAAETAEKNGWFGL
jgi:hypothetical protein